MNSMYIFYIIDIICIFILIHCVYVRRKHGIGIFEFRKKEG